MKRLAVFLAVAVLAGCAMVPERYDGQIGAALTDVWISADDLQGACGVAEQERKAQARLVRMVAAEWRYASFYGNEADKAAGAALAKAVGDFVPGIGKTYCAEHALNVKARVEREAKVLRERPRR